MCVGQQPPAAAEEPPGPQQQDVVEHHPPLRHVALMPYTPINADELAIKVRGLACSMHLYLSLTHTHTLSLSLSLTLWGIRGRAPHGPRMSQTDDVVLVSKTTNGGWWFGGLAGGAQGWFPTNYVSEKPVEAPRQRSMTIGRPLLVSGSAGGGGAGGVAAAAPAAAAAGAGAAAKGPAGAAKLAGASKDRIYDEKKDARLGIYEDPVELLAAIRNGAAAAGDSKAAAAPASNTIPRESAKIEPFILQQNWFMQGLPRDQVRWWAQQLKLYGSIGAFLVREPESQADAFALVFKEDDLKLKNYLIKCELTGFRLGALRAKTFLELLNLLGQVRADSPLPVPLDMACRFKKGAIVRQARRESALPPRCDKTIASTE